VGLFASLGVFAVAAMTAPLAGGAADRVVLYLLALGVAGAAAVDGRLAALTCAAMAALSFDFFHVAPIRELHPSSLLLAAAGYGAVAAVSPRRVRAACSED
jgi:K+-sensing histidine kinase KdpD